MLRSLQRKARSKHRQKPIGRRKLRNAIRHANQTKGQELIKSDGFLMSCSQVKHQLAN